MGLARLHGSTGCHARWIGRVVGLVVQGKGWTMSNEELTADIYKLASEVASKMTHCQRTGQLSRYMHLQNARDALNRAIQTPARDERQLTLESFSQPTTRDGKS